MRAMVSIGEQPAPAIVDVKEFLYSRDLGALDLIGKTVAHYRISEKLGEGGMGVVYRAHDSKLGREVAIKVLPEALSGDAERLARFEREARILASLNHPGIATLYGLENDGGKHFLVMELVPRETLAARIARGPLAIGEAISIFGQIADALEAAHEKRIIHRDFEAREPHC